jgi:hypothetical protein
MKKLLMLGLALGGSYGINAKVMENMENIYIKNDGTSVLYVAGYNQDKKDKPTATMFDGASIEVINPGQTEEYKRPVHGWSSPYNRMLYWWAVPSNSADMNKAKGYLQPKLNDFAIDRHKKGQSIGKGKLGVTAMGSTVKKGGTLIIKY